MGKTVYGDGIFYFSWVRSIVLDHSIDFSQEYQHFGATQPVAPTGLPGNKYSIGTALLWTPAFITTHGIVKGTGYALPYQLAVGITNVLLTLFAFALLLRILPGSFESKILTIFAISVATNLFFYGSVDAANSHALSFFAAVLYLCFALTKSPKWIAIGISLGLLASIRLQDVIYILILVPHWKKIRYSKLVTGFLVAFAPQLVAWSALYGNPWTNPYLAGGESFNPFKLHTLEVLFSLENGLFLWTPVALLGFIGLVAKRTLYWNFLLVFLVQLCIVASWSTWWQGASYSGRMFVSTLPLLAFGLTPGINWLMNIVGSQVTLLFIATLGALNVLSIFYFLLTH